MTDASDLSNSQATIYQVGRLVVSLSFFDRNDLETYMLVSGETIDVAKRRLSAEKYAHGRFQMVRKAAEKHPDKDLADRIIKLIDERTEIAKRRNRLMHDIWSYSKAEDAYRLLPENHVAGEIFPPPLIKVQDLEALVERAQTAAGELLTLIVCGKAV